MRWISWQCVNIKLTTSLNVHWEWSCTCFFQIKCISTILWTNSQSLCNNLFFLRKNVYLLKSTAIQIICTFYESKTLTFKSVLSYFLYTQTSLSTSSIIRSNWSPLRWTFCYFSIRNRHVNTKFRLEQFVCLKILRVVLSKLTPIHQSKKSTYYEVW